MAMSSMSSMSAMSEMSALPERRLGRIGHIRILRIVLCLFLILSASSNAGATGVRGVAGFAGAYRTYKSHQSHQTIQRTPGTANTAELSAVGAEAGAEVGAEAGREINTGAEGAREAGIEGVAGAAEEGSGEEAARAFTDVGDPSTNEHKDFSDSGTDDAEEQSDISYQNDDNDDNNEGSSNPSNGGVVYYHVFSGAVAAIYAWNTIVITLELNDFRHRLKTVTLSSPSTNQSIDKSSYTPTTRVLAAIVATRLGFRDALLDWAMLYSILYGIVAGFTWSDADPSSLLVLWGIGVIVAGSLFFLLGVKVPQWLGSYHKSRYQIINDTSTTAKSAVYQFHHESLPLLSFRYQVRLGIGRHFAKFSVFLLPFYIDLKPWAWLLSIVFGTAFAYAFLYVVFMGRQRFRNNKDGVSVVASMFLSTVSALLVSRGMYLIDEAWQWEFAKNNHVLFLVSFFGWLVFCLLFQIGFFVEHHKRMKKRKLAGMAGGAAGGTTGGGVGGGLEETARGAGNDGGEDIKMDDEVHLFDEDFSESEGYNTGLETLIGEDENGSCDVYEPLLASDSHDGSSTVTAGPGRRTVMRLAKDRESHNYLYQTGYFDPTSMHTDKKIKDSLRGAQPSTSEIDENHQSPYEIYQAFVAIEQSNTGTIKWHHTLWNFLPIKSCYEIFVIECKNLFGCCCKKDSSDSGDSSAAGAIGSVGASEKAKESIWYRLWLVTRGLLYIVFNGLALYVTLVACAATFQIQTTKSALPAVHEILYKHMNEIEVCAFDHKDGNIRQFDSKEEADLANYTIAHCGKCGHCSNWNDLELQYSTRHNLAARAQECGMKTLGKGIDALQECLSGPTIGWTDECGRCWAEDIQCTKKHCIFIYLQSRMTNQLGNFAVAPDTITTATCEEAHCEAGPDQFVPCSGATRRRMDITSSIKRPLDQRCTIVGVESWEDFFYPKY